MRATGCLLYGRETVPRICAILRKSYGGAYIVMELQDDGYVPCLAWPWAELGRDGRRTGGSHSPTQGDSRRTSDLRGRDDAERLLNPYIAAERGYIDGVIDPLESRR